MGDASRRTSPSPPRDVTAVPSVGVVGAQLSSAGGMFDATQRLLAQHRAQVAEDQATVQAEKKQRELAKTERLARFTSVHSNAASDHEPSSQRRVTKNSFPDKGFSGYVSVSHIVHEQEEVGDDEWENHFEIQDGLHNLVGENIMKFRFKRQIRRSLIVTLGTSADETAVADANHLDTYNQSSISETRTAFMALIVGFGSLSLPHSLSLMGLIPGLASLVAFSLLSYFICNRIVETPSLLEYSLENLIQAAGYTFGRSWVRIVTLISLISWMTPAVLYIDATGLVGGEVIDVISRHANATWFPETPGLQELVSEHRPTFMWGLFAVVAFSFVAFVMTAKDVRSIKKSSKTAWRSMVVLAFLIVFASGLHYWKEAIHNDNPSVMEIKWYPAEFSSDELSNLLSGAQGMFLAFGGLVIIPYIVAEMTRPEEAQYVMSQGVIGISLYYIIVAVVGYVGFADIWRNLDDIRQTTGYAGPPWIPSIMVRMYTLQESGHISALSDLEAMVFVGAGVISLVCLFLKATASLPIVLWPMMREFKFLFAYYEDPPTELQLPWALFMEKKRRLRWRLLICFIVLGMSLLVFLSKNWFEGGDPVHQVILVDFWTLLQAVIDVLPTFFMSFALPASVSLVAINRHWYLMEARQRRQEQINHHAMRSHRCIWDMRTPVNAKAIPYAGGSYRMHVIMTTLAFIAILGLLFLSVRQVLSIFNCNKKDEDEDCFKQESVFILAGFVVTVIALVYCTV